VLEKSEDELLSLRNFGRKSYDELRDKLVELGLLPPQVEGAELNGSVPIGRAPTPVEHEEPEDLSPLGAALIEALREAGEDPSELIKRKERDE